jgi:flagellar FliL protein
MSEETKDGAQPAQAAAQPKKKKGKLFMILGLVLAVAAGGAGGFLYFQKAAAKTKSDSHKGRKADQESDEDEGDHSEGKEKGDSEADVKRVIEIQPFILNLSDKDENRFLRLGMSLGLGDAGEEKPDQLFITRVRNAVLSVLMAKSSADVLSAEGKVNLRKEILEAVQKASEEPHVLTIYITELIVQR